MLQKEQLLAMLEMQAGMNAKVNPDWLAAGYPFLLAAVVEGAEAIEHAGWKWWKSQTRDLPQLRMELVDIWHFALSAELVYRNGDIESAATKLGVEHAEAEPCVIFDSATYWIEDLDLVRKLEILIGLAVARRFSVSLFASLLADCGMTWEDLYRQYVGKNTLNFFRQDFGYKAGTYIKVWSGREDNEHLVDILAIEDAAAADFRKRVYAALVERYKQYAKP